MDNATAPITFHMNAELAFNFEKACQELGLTTSEAFTIFATKVARERRIPFEIAVDPFSSKQNIARLKKSIARMEATGDAVGEVDECDYGLVMEFILKWTVLLSRNVCEQ